MSSLQMLATDPRTFVFADSGLLQFFLEFFVISKRSLTVIII